MPHKKVLRGCVQKFIYSLLIFCIGGVGSLTYFDGFLPGHESGQHPFHLSILEEPEHHHNPLPSLPKPEVLMQQMSLWLVSRFAPEADFILVQQHLRAGLAQFFQSGLSDGYLLVIVQLDIFNNTSLFGSVLATLLMGRSAFLPPPEKPPSLNFA